MQRLHVSKIVLFEIKCCVLLSIFITVSVHNAVECCLLRDKINTVIHP